jgi:hypothetical protein
MSSITDFLNLISGARYGRQVRQAIVDAISQCYEDGKAGVNDLQARRLIEAVMAVNSEQEVAIADLRMQIAEILGGGPSTETVGTTTTEVPTFIVETGIVQMSIPKYVDALTGVRASITFTEEFTEPPFVFAEIEARETMNAQYASAFVAPILNTITTTGFTLGGVCTGSRAISPSVRWIAIQPTTVKIDTEITVPATDDLTQEEINSLIGLLE